MCRFSPLLFLLSSFLFFPSSVPSSLHLSPPSYFIVFLPLLHSLSLSSFLSFCTFFLFSPRLFFSVFFILSTHFQQLLFLLFKRNFTKTENFFLLTAKKVFRFRKLFRLQRYRISQFPPTFPLTFFMFSQTFFFFQRSSHSLPYSTPFSEFLSCPKKRYVFPKS